MKNPRLIAIGTALALSALTGLTAATAFAETPGTAHRPSQPDPQKFEEYKAKALKFLDTRIQAMQRAQFCVQAATNVDQLRDCRRQEHQAMRAMREEMRKRHDGRGPGEPGGRSPAPEYR
ncbi:MAG: hypothetical protein HYU77_14180 [Betaproteobacteria bacterium]|nr:hypothetical protein [Betaproteobacteria bacterium]